MQIDCWRSIRLFHLQAMKSYPAVVPAVFKMLGMNTGKVRELPESGAYWRCCLVTGRRVGELCEQYTVVSLPGYTYPGCGVSLLLTFEHTSDSAYSMRALYKSRLKQGFSDHEIVALQQIMTEEDVPTG